MNVSMEVDIDVSDALDWLDNKQKAEIVGWFMEDGVSAEKVFDMLNSASSDDKLASMLEDVDLVQMIDVSKRILKIFGHEA